MKKVGLIVLALATLTLSCKKEGCTDETASNYNEKAKKDDGSCVFDESELMIPTTYVFTDANGNNTVSFGGQTDRLNQLEEMTTYMKSGIVNVLSSTVLNDMFANTDENGGGNFSFSSSKQLKNKSFPTDVPLFEGYLDSLADASVDFAIAATDGQAGTVTNGAKTYLVSANGIEYTQLIEKGLMGATFLYQANQVYFGEERMSAQNETASDPNAGKFYTDLEHHWDEAFGYFGAPIDYLTSTEDFRFWARYTDLRDAQLGSKAIIMNALLKGRAAIQQKAAISVRNEQIEIARKEWERVSAAQAVFYLEEARDNFGTDNAVYLHVLSEAYAFILSLKYVPLETRVINFGEIDMLLTDMIGDNFWQVTTVDLTNAINTINGIYNF